MTDDTKLKILRKRLDEYEKDQSNEVEQRDSIIAMGRAAMNLITASGGAKGRTKILDAIHEALMSIINVYPMDLNKLIVADLANDHSSREIMYDSLESIIDIDDIPRDIKERLDAVGDGKDKLRVNGIRRLQAFLKVRPAIIQAFKDQGMDVSGIPGAVPEDVARQRADSSRSNEKT